VRTKRKGNRPLAHPFAEKADAVPRGLPPFTPDYEVDAT
jgi:hypothetical protein